jgi:S-(hydroxymethyl)glutathione dehydrogenase/alcohol dehydrogenase
MAWRGKTVHFQAAVLHQTRTPLQIETVRLTELRPTDVLVQLHASGLCHTDLEVIEGDLPYPLPIVLGHEGAGIVQAMGSEVSHVKVGDPVICSWNPHCGLCFYCQRQQPILCEPFTRHQPAGHMLDGDSRYRLGHEVLHHFSVVSSHAQYCVVPASGAIPIPRDMPLVPACLIGCGVMTGVGAVVRKAQVSPGSLVAVVGAGAVGLNVVQGAVIANAARILVIDQDPQRLVLARQLGATDTLMAHEQIVDEVRTLTAGRGADFVFEAAGNERTLQISLEITRPGGHLVILGKTHVNRQVALRFGSLMGDKQIVRSSYGGASPLRDFPWLCSLYLQGKLKLDELIDHQLPLSRINEGFDLMRQGAAVRTVIHMDH